MNETVDKVNQYRTQIIGIASISVICTHSNEIIAWPKAVRNLLGYGGIGVYIFIFLSSIGLYYSLKFSIGIGMGGIKSKFYKRRFQKVFVPYLLIAATWYGIKYLLIQHNALGFFYELSTLSFWIDHQGA